VIHQYVVLSLKQIVAVFAQILLGRVPVVRIQKTTSTAETKVNPVTCRAKSDVKST